MAYNEFTYLPALLRAVQDGTHHLRKPPRFIVGPQAGYNPHENVYVLPGEPDASMDEADFLRLMFLGLHEGKAETDFSHWDPKDPRWADSTERKVIVNAVCDARIDKMGKARLPGYEAAADYQYAEAASEFQESQRTANAWNAAVAIKLGTYLEDPDFAQDLVDDNGVPWTDELKAAVKESIEILTKLPTDNEEDWIDEALRLMKEFGIDQMEQPKGGGSEPEDEDGEVEDPDDSGEGGDGGGEDDSEGPDSPSEGDEEDKEGQGTSDDSKALPEQSAGPATLQDMDLDDASNYDEKKSILEALGSGSNTNSITANVNGYYFVYPIWYTQACHDCYENGLLSRPKFDWDPLEEAKLAQKYIDLHSTNLKKSGYK